MRKKTLHLSPAVCVEPWGVVAGAADPGICPGHRRCFFCGGSWLLAVEGLPLDYVASSSPDVIAYRLAAGLSRLCSEEDCTGVDTSGARRVAEAAVAEARLMAAAVATAASWLDGLPPGVREAAEEHPWLTVLVSRLTGLPSPGCWRRVRRASRDGRGRLVLVIDTDYCASGLVAWPGIIYDAYSRGDSCIVVVETGAYTARRVHYAAMHPGSRGGSLDGARQPGREEVQEGDGEGS